MARITASSLPQFESAPRVNPAFGLPGGQISGTIVQESHDEQSVFDFAFTAEISNASTSATMAAPTPALKSLTVRRSSFDLSR